MAAVIASAVVAAETQGGGLWTKTTHPDPLNITIFYIEGSVVKAIGYGQISEKPTVWYAEGTIRNGRMTLSYRYSEDTAPEGWELYGIMQLQLSPDGGFMTGTATSRSKRWSDRIAFERLNVPR